MTPERPLPASLEAERLVLGCLMQTESAMDDARPLLSPDDFSVDAHRTIWAALCDQYDAGRSVDRVTVIQRLSDSGMLEKAGGFGYLLDLESNSPQTVHIGDYIQIIRDKATLRRVIQACSEVAQRAYGNAPIAEVLDATTRIAMDLTPAIKGRGFVSLRDYIAETGINAILSPRRDKGIPLPWPHLNRILCGLHPEQLIVVAAHTSCGKTSMALQIATEAARKGVGVAIFSLEMSTGSLIARMVNQIGRINDERWRHDALSRDERDAQSAALNELHSLPIYCDDAATVSMAGIHAALRKLSLQHKIGLVVVDFLQIVRGSGRYESRNQEVGGNARALKLAAKEFRCPFLVLSQLSRKSNADDREPKLEDLRDSGEIEENADVVMFIHPSKAPGISKPAKVIVAKQREGPRDVWADMLFFPAHQRFEEAANA